MATLMQQAGGMASAPEAGLSLKDLQQLLLAEFGAAAAARIQWCLSPFEYLARRRGHQQLFVDSVSVSALLPHIPFVLEYCTNLVAASTASQAAAAARKSAAFTSQVLAVLSVRGVQEQLGGTQQLQPYISVLEAALPSFQVASQQQPSNAATPGTSTGTRQSSAGHAAGFTAGLPPAGPSSVGRAGRGHPAAGAGQTAAGPRAPRSSRSSSSTEFSLAALVAAVAPFAAQASNPLSPDFPELLEAWGRLVYGELADPGGILVAHLMMYHWKTLLRFLRLCLLGEASVGSGSPRPMPVSTAILHVEGLLHLLQYASMQALFTQQQFKKVTARFTAIRTLLQSLPQPTPGQAPVVSSFCSAAVEALVQARSAATQDAMDVDTDPSNSVLPAETAAAPPSVSARSEPHQEPRTAQQLLLSLADGQLHTGALTPEQLDAVQELLAALKRQVEAGGSNQLEATMLPE